MPFRAVEAWTEACGNERPGLCRVVASAHAGVDSEWPVHTTLVACTLLLFPGGEWTMLSSETGKRSSAEIAFLLLRTLAAGQALWGPAGALLIANLGAMLHADAAQVDGALDCLSDEGMIDVDESRGVVRLTERAQRDLLC